ncbi:hypothetical protein U0355_09025 [Salimicrobium sp. PL1-032A]|uniref:hypothetical protein n=1 Tax=Salimicrobium sp. PL1-032A TaxID=3095364 RepID=UPI00326034DE
MIAVFGVIFVVIFHITVSEFLLRRKWGIEPESSGLSWSGRHKRFVAVELLLVLAAFSFLFVTGGRNGTFFVVPLLLAGVFSLRPWKRRRGIRKIVAIIMMGSLSYRW